MTQHARAAAPAFDAGFTQEDDSMARIFRTRYLGKLTEIGGGFPANAFLFYMETIDYTDLFYFTWTPGITQDSWIIPNGRQWAWYGPYHPGGPQDRGGCSFGTSADVTVA